MTLVSFTSLPISVRTEYIRKLPIQATFVFGGNELNHCLIQEVCLDRQLEVIQIIELDPILQHFHNQTIQSHRQLYQMIRQQQFE